MIWRKKIKNPGNVDEEKEKVEDDEEKVEDKQERIDEEPKGEKEKESEEVNKEEKETASTEILLVPFLPTNEDIPFTLVTQMAEYVKVRLAKYNKKPSPFAPITIQDSHEQVLNNVDDLAKLTKLKKSLRKFYTQLTIQGKQDNANIHLSCATYSIL